jgi:hypothetical protein
MFTLSTALPGECRNERAGFVEGLEPLHDKQSHGIQLIQCERFRYDFNRNRLAHIHAR